MNKEEILNKYRGEKDEGYIYVQNKALNKGFSGLMMVLVMFLLLGFFCGRTRIVSDMAYFLAFPFLVIYYGFKAYYLKENHIIFKRYVGHLFILLTYLELWERYFNEWTTNSKNNLKEIRNEQGLSQSALAKMVGVSRNTISSIETGQFNPTAKLALILCIALDKKFEEIFYFD